MQSNSATVTTIGPYSATATLAKRDGRTREARLVRDTRAALIRHVGGSPTIAQRMLIDRVAQLTLRIATMDRKFAETEVQTEHDSRCYLAWTGSLSRLLRDLGLAAAPPPAPDPNKPFWHGLDFGRASDQDEAA